MPRVLPVTVKWFPLDDVSCGIADMGVWMSSIHLGINSNQFKQPLGPFLSYSGTESAKFHDVETCTTHIHAQRLERHSTTESIRSKNALIQFSSREFSLSFHNYSPLAEIFSITLVDSKHAQMTLLFILCAQVP